MYKINFNGEIITIKKHGKSTVRFVSPFYHVIGICDFNFYLMIAHSRNDSHGTGGECTPLHFLFSFIFFLSVFSSILCFFLRCVLFYLGYRTGSLCFLFCVRLPRELQLFGLFCAYFKVYYLFSI